MMGSDGDSGDGDSDDGDDDDAVDNKGHRDEVRIWTWSHSLGSNSYSTIY